MLANMVTRLVAVTSPTSLQSTPSQGPAWLAYAGAPVCVVFAGIMSGLTVGLASIDRLALEIDASGNPERQLMNERIFEVIDHHHWMLVTLLLCNAAALECLPIFLDLIFPSATAVLISVICVLIFAEIIP